MNLELITKQVVNLSKTVGHFVHSKLSVISVSDIEEKGLHDLVTFVDKEAENRLVSERSDSPRAERKSFNSGRTTIGKSRRASWTRSR